MIMIKKGKRNEKREGEGGREREREGLEDKHNCSYYK